jgi:hypothetical protein
LDACVSVWQQFQGEMRHPAILPLLDELENEENAFACFHGFSFQCGFGIAQGSDICFLCALAIWIVCNFSAVELQMSNFSTLTFVPVLITISFLSGISFLSRILLEVEKME